MPLINNTFHWWISGPAFCSSNDSVWLEANLTSKIAQIYSLTTRLLLFPQTVYNFVTLPTMSTTTATTKQGVSILIVGGNDSKIIGQSEIVQIVSKEQQTCPLPQLKENVMHATGKILVNDKMEEHPVICGGLLTSSEVSNRQVQKKNNMNIK